MSENGEVLNKARPIYSATDSISQTKVLRTNVTVGIMDDVNVNVNVRQGVATRNQALVLFDRNSKSLYSFDHKRGAVTKMYAYPDAIARLRFSAVSFGCYIYVFLSNRSAYRFQYDQQIPEWERIRDWIEDHGDREPSVVCSSNTIFMVGGWIRKEERASSAVSRYDTSSDRWKILGDKPTATSRSALACNDRFLYCIGGMNSDNNPVSVVERMDLGTQQWTGITEMEHGRFLASAVEVGGNIYVVDRNRQKLEIEMYDSQTGIWETRNSLDIANTGTAISKCFAIDRNLFVVCSDRIVIYDMERDAAGHVTRHIDKRFQEAVLVEFSRTFL